MKSLEASHDNSPLGIVISAIHEDELAYRLSEINMVRPPSYQWHRYQIILVIRDDKIVEWWNDLGPRKANQPQFTIPSLWEHTVAELRAIAEETRLGDTYWLKRSEELQSESTMITDLIEQSAERSQIINNRSVFGYKGQHQRNGYTKRNRHGNN